ncbi:MAG: hypothetical protein KF886_16340 [Candidatus Hydrogenedentes bacterium]|nr:hypothetical protein [Candidatus Hydrogenedentota bacterium]
MEDLDGDPDTEDEYGPEYYGLALMKVFQQAPVPPAEVGEYEYVALVVTPNAISLREWDADEVTVLDTAGAVSEAGVWYDIAIAIDGATLTVSRGPRGGTLTQVLSADTTLTNASTDIGFGVGEKADYLFDDVRFFDPTATGEQSTIGRRYAYDARGRRVAETTFEDGVAETTYFVYDGHRVIEELDGNGNVTASYVYGQYIDEVLQMRRDTDPGAAGMEDHYYLHDDLFNVVGLADASGALRERYEYADYGAPTIYTGDGTATRTESAYGNPFLLQKACTRPPYRFSTGAPGFSSFFMHAITTSTNSPGAAPPRRSRMSSRAANPSSSAAMLMSSARPGSIHGVGSVRPFSSMYSRRYFAARRAVTIR